MKARHMICAALVATAFLTTGCSYERLVKHMDIERPAWIDEVPPATETVVPFVGLGYADMLAFEKRARDDAMGVDEPLVDIAETPRDSVEEIRLQVAAMIKTEVVNGAIEILVAEGIPVQASSVTDENYCAGIEGATMNALKSVKPQAHYWEKWQHKDHMFSAAYVQYKYWILYEMPRADLEALVAASRQGLVNFLRPPEPDEE